MTSFPKTIDSVALIQSLTHEALNVLSESDLGYKNAKSRMVRPVDYMRYAEFETILSRLNLKPNMRILDVSSPQALSLYLAKAYPECTFYYTNLIDEELNPFIAIAKAVGLTNLVFQKANVCQLNYPADTFDKVVSVSVIEHIFPAEGGDVTALNEIRRVLKSEGEFFMTVPYKSQGRIVYVDASVYDRDKQVNNFFAREYDSITFNKLVNACDFANCKQSFICEKKGLLSPDYYEWGPGKKSWMAKLVKARRIPEKVAGVSFERQFAEHYLTISETIVDRVVNVAAVFSG